MCICMVGVATVCIHSSCIIDRLHGRKNLWTGRCMQKPEYRARDVAALEDFLQILCN